MDKDVTARIEQLEAKVDALMNRVASLEGKPAAKTVRILTDDDSKKQHP